MDTFVWRITKLQQLRASIFFVTSCLSTRLAWADDSAAAVLPSASDQWSSVLLVFLCLLCAVAAWYVWHKRQVAITGLDYRLQIVGGISFSAKERLVLVKTQDRLLLLGVTAHQISLLKELSEADFLVSASTSVVTKTD